MFNFLNKLLGGVVTKKSDKDLKAINPIVDLINQEYDSLSNISPNELRLKSFELRDTIRESISGYQIRIDEINTQVNDTELGRAEKEQLFSQLDQIIIERNKALEIELDQKLPLAFAIMKRTAQFFKDKSVIEVEATDRDRQLAKDMDYLDIVGNNAVYHNSWDAAGGQIVWDMLHYDVQLFGGVVLHQGKIAEMGTGEGKTLVSTLPSYLNALAGLGVHLVTVNDYLARRDCEWMSPLFEFLGITVDCIEYHDPNSEDRRQAYRADLTYGTNNEFGFDYLRDNMASDLYEIVQRRHHYAMVDEVDSVLIDDARTPLIISGPTPRGDQHLFDEMKPKVERLVTAQKQVFNTYFNVAKKILDKGVANLTKDEAAEAGLNILRCYRGLPKNKPLIKFLSEAGMRTFLQRWENHYLQDSAKQMPTVDKELYFVIDEKNNSIELAEKGIELMTGNSEDTDFFVLPDVGTRLTEIQNENIDAADRVAAKDNLMKEFAVKSERIHTVNQLLKAYTLFEIDIEYIVDEGKVKIVDEQTGRVLDGRRYSDGLHQAIEAKENVNVEAATQTYATVTLQNYFRMYHKLCGMTGTAETEAEELYKIYKLDVIVIPTNREIIRDDRQDLVYKTGREKFNSVIEEIQKLRDAGRPVLVGTTSVEISELVSRLLSQRKIKHNVLNAKQHQREAEVVQEAGQAGTVTIATNMAGRGTDIKLGAGVKEAGGLAIIGTERHESRRVDRQLRGRAGRQGDPGSSQFYVSLEDPLMRLFGSERIAGIMDKLKMEEGEMLQHSMITKSIERAQKKVEQNNFGIRKRLLEYDDVMNSQRELIYKRRRNALYGDRLELDIIQMIEDLSNELIGEYHMSSEGFEQLELETIKIFATDLPFTSDEFQGSKAEDLADAFFEHLYETYKRKSKQLAESAYPVIKNVYETEGAKYENIVVPFTDGIRSISVVTPLKKAYDSEGGDILRNFEKSIVLNLIDDAWKEHLLEMDELRNSVQNAVYEQKDPLLIYKKDSFELFNMMLSKISKDTLGLLFKGQIEADDEPVQKKAPQRQAAQVKVKASRPEYFSSSTTDQSPQNNQNTLPPPPEPSDRQKLSPVVVGDKVGRNDPCPCGSGKKYKNCHGNN
ncbi:MAG: preprotein translocase subunit SecA [Bacteroidota bacterium]|nr:preprotein translocase subunit SecA [Bacteroidota bacterium]